MKWFAVKQVSLPVNNIKAHFGKKAEVLLCFITQFLKNPVAIHFG
jgi:hypothetical protein